MRPPGNEADTQDLPTAEVPAATVVAFLAATVAAFLAVTVAAFLVATAAAFLAAMAVVNLAAMAVAMVVVPMVATARCVDLLLLLHPTEYQDLHHLTDHPR